MGKLLSFICALVLSCLFPGFSWGQAVSVEEAEAFANEFFGEGAQAAGKAKLASASKAFGKEDGNFFIFNNSTGEGFVIVSGDNRTEPVLGWADKGSFCTDSLPPNMIEWLGYIDSYITAVKTLGGVSYKEKETYAAEDAKPQKVVLHKTAAWGQHSPFNDLCPEVNGRKTITGCSATAIAIVMRYFKYPNSGSGVTAPYSYTDVTGTYRTMSSGSYSKMFMWNFLPLENPYSWTDNAKASVAQLLYLCGLACQCSFGPDATPGYTSTGVRAMNQHLGYTYSNHEYSSSYTTDQWIQKMKEHIDNIGPLVYAASKGERSHAFVVDGYDSNLNFHINWGWGGYMDGYYAFPSFDVYTKEHVAYFGLKPDKTNVLNSSLMMTNASGCNGLYLDKGVRVKQDQEFFLNCGYLTPQKGGSFEGSVVVALVNKDGKIREYISSPYNVNYTNGSGSASVRLTCKISKPIYMGDAVALYYQKAGTTTLLPVRYDPSSVTGKLTIKANLPSFK